MLLWKKKADRSRWLWRQIETQDVEQKKGGGRMTDESPKAGVLGRLPPWPRTALNNSVIAMEQAYRQRKGLPPLSDADIEALKAGQPMAWESGNGGSAPVAASSAPPV